MTQNRIDVVLLTAAQTPGATEYRHTLAQLRQSLPDDVQWLVGLAWADALDYLLDRPGDSRILLLEHGWVGLERRCLERLAWALEQGYDCALACDSRRPAPMNLSYATLRGMERMVDAYAPALLPPDPVAEQPPALVQLTSLDGLRRLLSAQARCVRVVGAYAHDGSGYFAADRSEVLPLVPPAARCFLDVGGGVGGFLAQIKTGQAAAVTHLVEQDAGAAAQARCNRSIDRVWQGDFLDYRTTQRYDCISLLDVLEHTAEPQRYLTQARSLLAPDGVLLLSVPNVGHWSVVADLLEGRWDYVAAGIHCVTHLRFFTLQTLLEALRLAGFALQRIERVVVPAPPDWLATWRASAGLVTDDQSLQTYAFMVTAQPASQMLP